MPEHSSNIGDDLISNIMETISDTVQKKKSVTFFEEDGSGSSKLNKLFGQKEDESVSAKMNKLFGRQKPVHNLLGGGKSADVLLWRNKKISLGVLASATAIWILFEWLNYNLLPLVCFALVVGMLVQFVWTNASGLLSRSPSQVPRLVFPDELFVNIGVTVGTEINRFLRFLQDVASGRDLKQFLVVVASLMVAAIMGSWCNFLTVIYIGFVAAHTLPVIYEKYDDQIDGFVYNLLGQLQSQYRKLDKGVLSKIPKGKFRAKKFE